MLTVLMAGVLLRREPVAEGEAVEVVAVPSEAEAVEPVVQCCSGGCSLVTRLVLEPGSYCTRMRQIFLECQETVLLLVNCRVMLTSSEQL